MVFHRNIFIVIANSIFYFTYYVSAYSKEAILGGIPAPLTQFTYQASIIGLKNGSNDYTLLGGGAVVSDNHVVSSANVFILPSGELQPWTFYVVVGKHDTSNWITLKIDIEHIFFPSLDLTFLYINIAVAKSKRSFGIGRNPHVSKLRLPYPEELFPTEATVSGFGYFLVNTGLSPDFPVPIATSGTFSSVLRHRKVNILADNQCAISFSGQVTETNFCGVTANAYQGEGPVGLCKGDTGNPLVLRDLLIGIASTIIPNCDNTVFAALYMKVAVFKEQIENFLKGTVASNALVLENNPSVSINSQYSNF